MTATNGGQDLSAVAVTIDAQTVTNDGGGSFSMIFSPFQGNLRVMLAASGIVTRVATAAVNATRTLSLDATSLGGSLDKDFSRQRVRNTFDAPMPSFVGLSDWQKAALVEFLKTL